MMNQRALRLIICAANLALQGEVKSAGGNAGHVLNLVWLQSNKYCI